MHNEKKYDELPLEWQPYYKPEHVNIEMFKVLKLAPAQYAVVMMNLEAGDFAIVCVYKLKSMAVKYVEYSNKGNNIKAKRININSQNS